MTKTLVLSAVLVLSSLTFARNRVPDPKSMPDNGNGVTAASIQTGGSAKPLATEATSTCAYTFTSGGTATKQYLQYCVTVNGNIVEFQSPSGVEHIRAGVFGEGYAICDFASGLGYHDYADYGDSDTGSWGPSTTLTHTATLVKIARTTSDGIWTLTQTIQQSAPDASAKVTMALKNNTAISRTVWLTRFVDIDANSTFANNFAATFNKSVGYVPGFGNFGLELGLAAANPYSHYGFSSLNIDNACDLSNGIVSTITGQDGSAYFYHGISIGAGKTATVKLKYQGM